MSNQLTVEEEARVKAALARPVPAHLCRSTTSRLASHFRDEIRDARDRGLGWRQIAEAFESVAKISPDALRKAHKRISPDVEAPKPKVAAKRRAKPATFPQPAKADPNKLPAKQRASADGAADFPEYLVMTDPFGKEMRSI